MTSTAPAFDSEHPLVQDQTLLNEILDVMYLAIHKRLHGVPRPRRSSGPERVIVGGTSVEDVLQEALADLLAYPHEGISGSWRALGVDIASKRAVDAWRTSNKGLRGTDHRHEIRVVSGDSESSEGESGPAIFDVLPAKWTNAEDEYFALADVRDLRDLALEILDDRERQVFFDIHFLGYTRKIVGKRLGLTGARAGQIYNAAMRRLEADPRYPYR